MPQRYQPKDPTLYYSGGCVVNKNFVAVSCGLLEAPDAKTSVIMMQDDANWAGHVVDQDFIVSMAYSDETNTLYGLGKFGMIKSVQVSGKFSLAGMKGRWIEQQLPSASGIHTGIAVAGAKAFACGWSGKLYEMRDRQWRPCATGMERQKECDFLDICCVGDDEVYVVGMKGVIFYHDGKRWHDLDSPTNQHLQSVAPSSEGGVYVAGKGGVLYKGNKDGWQFIGNPGVTSDFWSVREFNGNVYISDATDALLKHDGVDLSKVNMGIEYLVNTNKLDCKDGVLWSFGIDDLVKFDGARWQYITCPENE